MLSTKGRKVEKVLEWERSDGINNDDDENDDNKKKKKKGVVADHHQQHHHHHQQEQQDDLQTILLLQQMKTDYKTQRTNLTMFVNPVNTINLFLQHCVIHVYDIVHLSVTKYLTLTISCIVMLCILTCLRFLEGSHQPVMQLILNRGYIALEWIALGVLSSVGLGTGLHTFVLYLGPFIAKVTMAANECNSIDFNLYGSDAFTCPIATMSSSSSSSSPVAVAVTASGVSFWQIVQKVQFAALCWGLGTAIGELPPYFVARGARLSGKAQQSVDEDDDDDNDDDSTEQTLTTSSDSMKSSSPSSSQSSNTTSTRTTTTTTQTSSSSPAKTSIIDSLSSRIQPYLTYLVENYAFVAIVVLASVPNPLFDLAGITCGYSLIPFWTFFGATLLGKAVIKANLQAFLVVMVFSKRTLEWMVQELESLLPRAFKGKITDFFEQERMRFHPERNGDHNQHNTAGTPNNMLKHVWDTILFIMIAYFIISIVNSMAQTRLLEKQKLELEKFKTKHMMNNKCTSIIEHDKSQA